MGKRALLVGVSSFAFLTGLGCSAGSFLGSYATWVGPVVDTAVLINIIAGLFGLPPVIPNA